MNSKIHYIIRASLRRGICKCRYGTKNFLKLVGREQIYVISFRVRHLPAPNGQCQLNQSQRYGYLSCNDYQSPSKLYSQISEETRLHESTVLQTHKLAVSSSRLYSTEPLPEPQVEGKEKQYSTKIQKIVDDIGKLTLLEVADLNDLLKKTLKIQDAPVMAMGAVPAAAVQKEEVEEEAAPVREKTVFAVKLVGFDEGKKIALIKEIKNLIPGTNLVQAKKFVESVPVSVKTDLIKEEAEKLVKALEGAGGKAQID